MCECVRTGYLGLTRAERAMPPQFNKFFSASRSPLLPAQSTDKQQQEAQEEEENEQEEYLLRLTIAIASLYPRTSSTPPTIIMLAGKRCLVVGLANHRSLAWGCAQAWRAAGAQVLVSSLPRFQPSIHKLLASSWPEAKAQGPEQFSLACDVMDSESVNAMMAQVSERFNGELDVLLHAVAYASAPAMQGAFIDTTAEDYAQAHLVSSHSLLTLAREALPLLTHGSADTNSDEDDTTPRKRKRNSSILTLSYLGSQRAILPYKVMGPAKASLEATVRLLAAELGPPPHQIRVNALSPGPINTLSARGIPGFADMCKEAAAAAPLRRNADIEDVGGAAVFLASDAAKAITGQMLYVDGGLSVM